MFFAKRLGIDIELDIIEAKNFSKVGPSGCNHCGGIISESLVQILSAEGIIPIVSRKGTMFEKAGGSFIGLAELKETKANIEKNLKSDITAFPKVFATSSSTKNGIAELRAFLASGI